MGGPNVVSRCLYDDRETDIITKTSTSTFSRTTDNDGQQLMATTCMTPSKNVRLTNPASVHLGHGTIVEHLLLIDTVLYDGCFRKFCKQFI